MKMPDGFDKLWSSFTRGATDALQQIGPEYVNCFREALGRTKDLARARDAVRGIKIGPEFDKWRDIWTALLDVELAMHQIKLSLSLLKSTAPPQVSQGEWVYYHYHVWALLMDGLLERVVKVTKKIVRGLARPANPDWKNVETELLRTVEQLKRDMGKLRDPIAHGGGAVEAVAEEGWCEVNILLGGHPSGKDLLKPMDTFQDRWYEKCRDSSALALAEIIRLCEQLCGLVPVQKL